MTFVYFWLVCGVVSFTIYVIEEYSRGRDGKLDQLSIDLFSSCLFGPIGLIATLGILLESVFGKYKDEVIIKGRKK